LARWSRLAAVGVAVVTLMGCALGTTTVSVVVTPTATATATPKPTATATPAPGVCDSADFPTKTNGGPSPFQYPPLTYYYDESPGMGNHTYLMCSSGNPSSILAFMKNSVTAAQWKVTSTTATTLSAENPTNPPSGFCYTVDITVGAKAAYPGEWSIDFHPPAAQCV
jgi:hypothetical protein